MPYITLYLRQRQLSRFWSSSMFSRTSTQLLSKFLWLIKFLLQKLWMWIYIVQRTNSIPRLFRLFIRMAYLLWVLFSPFCLCRSHILWYLKWLISSRICISNFIIIIQIVFHHFWPSSLRPIFSLCKCFPPEFLHAFIKPNHEFFQIAKISTIITKMFFSLFNRPTKFFYIVNFLFWILSLLDEEGFNLSWEFIYFNVFVHHFDVFYIFIINLLAFFI